MGDSNGRELVRTEWVIVYPAKINGGRKLYAMSGIGYTPNRSWAKRFESYAAASAFQADLAPHGWADNARPVKVRVYRTKPAPAAAHPAHWPATVWVSLSGDGYPLAVYDSRCEEDMAMSRPTAVKYRVDDDQTRPTVKP